MSEPNISRGLEGVIVAESSIAKIDGANGCLYYMGYPITELAQHSSFEEVTCLLLYSRLPSKGELSVFSRHMREARVLPDNVLEMVRTFPVSAHPMELLQSSIAYLSGYHTHQIEHSSCCNCRETLHQISQLATVIAVYHRFSEGLEIVLPRMDLSHGANFLYMLRGEAPSALEGEIMDKSLILHAEHGMNASTFTARVVASTLSTCYCSVSAAMGALYGSLHGGANEKVLEQIESIGSVENVEAWVDEKLIRKDKIMGMGHRVYKVIDPRASIMREFLIALSREKGDTHLLDMLKELERVTGIRMKEKGKEIWPNVDFFSGAVYSLLGIPGKLFTPIFAMARVAGWLAHILEQRADNRIFRPRSLYKGVEPRSYPLPGE